MDNSTKTDKIVFFDVDNTIINGYTQKYFIEYLFKINIISFRVLFLSYLWFLLYKLHIVKNIKSAVNFYISFLDGWDEDMVTKLVEDFCNLYIKDNFFLEIKRIIEDYKAEGSILVLVSASLEPIVKCVANYLNIDNYIATRLELKDGLYTGKIFGNVAAGDEKLRLVKYFLNLNGNRNIMTYFYSDHFSDEALLNFVDNPFVVNPDKILYNKAKNKGWNIIKIKK